MNAVYITLSIQSSIINENMVNIQLIVDRYVLDATSCWGSNCTTPINLLKPTGYVMHQQFNIQQLYALPTLYLCVLYLSENKQRLVPLNSIN